MATKKAAPKKAVSKKASSKKTKVGFDPSAFICNVEPSKDTEQDWSYATSVSAGALTAPAAPPPAVDLRQPWWTINNQESTGSCVGWATADGVGRYQMEHAGKVSQKQLLSPRFIWMASKETDTFTTRPESFVEGAGTTLKAAVDVARRYGYALEADLPFHIATNMYLGNEDAFFASCAMRKISAYFNLQRNLTNWKMWLATKGPLLVGLSVDSAWDNATANGGLVDTFDPGSVRGGHAVAVVGYRADGRFIVRNSWGTDWGDKGFAYVSPSYINAGFFNEAYGVTV
jgi:C1A family cysteine protease